MQKKCLICGQPLPEQSLMKLPGMPASAQDIPDEQQVISDHGITLQLVQCEACGLVQFCITPVAYYKDVIRAGGFSTTMVELRRSQYRHLINTYHLEGRKFLEVGCGRGEFLKVLTEFPVTAYGVEHKTDLIRMAQAEGLTVFPGFTETADTVLGEHGPYDVFLSFNFLEHQPDPGKMLDCISHNLAEDGMGLITVPSLEYILNYDGYYELIRDHIAYYSFETLRYLLELHGFLVLEEELVNRDTCAVIVRKNPDVAKNAVKPQWQPVDLSGLQSGKDVLVRELQHLAEELLAQHRKLALWGAGHQGFTLAATTCIGEAAQYIIDSAPFKQGRFAPASHLPIVSPEYYEDHPVDVILIVAPGYTREIAETIRSRYGRRVKILMLRSDHLEEWKETV
ncbi:MAG: class I SAM-dependent methyltransferase [Hungatella sp.]